MEIPFKLTAVSITALCAISCQSTSKTCSDKCDTSQCEDQDCPDSASPDAANHDEAKARLTISKSSDSMIESEPHLATAPDGTTMVSVWTARHTPEWDGAGHIGYAFSVDGGITWSEPGALNFPSTADPMVREHSVNVKVTSDSSGNFWMVWLARSYGGWPDAVVVAKADSGSTVFGPAIEVTDSAAGLWYDLPAVTTSGDQVIVAYNSAADDTCQENVIARSMNGTDWTRTVASSCVPEKPIQNITALCATSDAVWLAYIIGTGERFEVAIRRSIDGGSTWTEAVTISKPEELVSFDSSLFCTTSKNGAYVAYGTTNDTPTPGIFGKLNSIQVVHVGEDLVVNEHINALASDDNFGLHPQLTLDKDDNLHVFYLAGKEDGDTNASLRWTQKAEGEDTFGPSQVVDGPFTFQQTWGVPGFLGDYFGVTPIQDDIGISYSVHQGSDVHIAFRRLRQDSSH